MSARVPKRIEKRADPEPQQRRRDYEVISRVLRRLVNTFLFFCAHAT